MLNEEFSSYQILASSDTPNTIKQSANICEEDPHSPQSGYSFGYLQSDKVPGLSQLAFPLLFHVAEVVMRMCHSNWRGKNIFTLKMNTLSSVKTHISN